MSDHSTSHGEAHDHPHVNYMKIFWILLGMTVAEYFYAMLTQDHFAILVIGLMAMALFKASLVGLYFMHVKMEGKWVYAMIIPACVLAILVVVALIPDIAVGRSTEDFSQPEDDSAMMTPGLSAFSKSQILRS